MARPPEPSAVSLVGVSRDFGALPAVDDVTVTFPAGRLSVVIGPSGSGKSTLLNLIAGLLVPSQGAIRIAEADVTSLAAEKRGVGFVFQSYALFPHLTVAGNVAFGVDARGQARDVIVDRELERFRIGHLRARRPSDLSGGERQRVALARAFAAEPRVLLLDEPLSALDAQLRDALRNELYDLLQSAGRTAIYVTHDRSEAMLLGDHIVLMQSGRLIQAGTPTQLYRSPSSEFVASFFGDANFISGVVDASGRAAESPLGVIAIANGPLPAGSNVRLLIRPEMFVMGGAISMHVRRATFLGPRWRVEGEANDCFLRVDLPDGAPVEGEANIALSLAAHAVPAF